MLAGIFVFILGVELVLQIASGVYHTERGHYPDEASHFTNGLLIRDYLRTGLGQSPLRFAEDYYLRFPKVALLMWPPLLHVTLGVAMLLPFPPNTLALLLMAVFIAWIAFRSYQITADEFGPWAGAAVALVMVGLEAMQDAATAVMADILVAVMALEAARYLAKYWETSATRDALWLGLFTALACLAKGNGLAVVLMCPVMLLVSGRWEVLKQRGLYGAAAIVLFLAGPFIAISWYFYRLNSSFYRVTPARILSFTSQYLGTFVDQTGWSVAVAAALGMVVALTRNRRPIWLALLSLWLAAIEFHSTTSQAAGIDPRYITMGYAPFLILAAMGIHWCIQLFSERKMPRNAAMVLLAAIFLATKFSVLHRQPLGFAEAAKMLRRQIGPDERILVASDTNGEGAFVAEFASFAPQPAVTILRSTKILIDADWLSNHLQMRYRSPEEAMDDLEAMQVGYFLVDESPDLQSLPYVNLANRMAHICSSRLERIAQFGPAQGDSHSFSVYRLRNRPTGPRKKFQISLQYTLGKTIER